MNTYISKSPAKQTEIIMPRTITLHLSEENFRLLHAYARAENQTLTNAIETLALKQIEERLFVDQLEMEEIRKKKKLLKRLKSGSEQAKRMKGRFVE